MKENRTLCVHLHSQKFVTTNISSWSWFWVPWVLGNQVQWAGAWTRC